METKDIYYGDWKYNSVHNRITSWIDDAGPQASFKEDFDASMQASRRLRRYLCCAR
ncbi:predicted protein [Plenodomus lingam JN3]|uniref:Predicted protein n=1 Tax=Leptosphaeria maculans (strain JN3 / isolate v23.1.3 / race Av1-4-5-6-7-8) TaxID=985895 RepID=E4ZJP0_LEPMJ|nr:predicted protein [Plenodomus lingam JN3]CBX91325.1 predicted protein [Plenodomus lingam JN3]